MEFNDVPLNVTAEPSATRATARRPSGAAGRVPMKLLTKTEEETLVRQASSVARVPATTKDVQNALSANDRDTIVLNK